LTNKWRVGSVGSKIVDQPTIRLLRRIIMDLEDQIRWGQEILKELKQAGIHPTVGVYDRSSAPGRLDAGGGQSHLLSM
jgi:hypothetical protein